jgi:hypothetical protein
MPPRSPDLLVLFLKSRWGDAALEVMSGQGAAGQSERGLDGAVRRDDSSADAADH